MLNTPVIQQFFFLKVVLSQKTMKNCFEETFDHFLGKGGYLTVFSREAVISEEEKKRRKTVFDGQIHFEGKVAFNDENEYNIFLWEMRFRICFHITFFF